MVRHGYSDAESEAIRRWKLTVMATSHQTEGVMLLVLTGRYIGFLPDHFARAWEEKSKIRAILPQKIQKTTEIIAITHKAGKANPMVRQFLSLMAIKDKAA